MAKPLKIRKLSPDDPVFEASVRILTTRLKEFYSHWPDPDQPPRYDELHNMRISSKRLRYSAESLCELFPDKLALLIELLKRSQDLLGEIQDCVTQGAIIEEELRSLRRRKGGGEEIAVLEDIISNYRQQRDLLFMQVREVWRGMTRQEFRGCLRAMVSHPKVRKKDDDLTTFILINPY